MSNRPPLRSFVAISLVLAAAGASSASAQVTLKSSLVLNGFTEPLFVTSPPGDTSRLFVVEHRGVIKIIKDGVLLPTPFLNIDPIVSGGSGGDERGLLGLAFHPDYANNRRFYIDYTDASSAEVLREYLADPLDPDVADTSSFTTLFGPYADPQSNHNGGCLQFGPDGMLYYSLGDGGNFNDTGTGHDPATGNAQSMATYFGKMLRFDVDNAPTYLPADNPFPASAIPLAWAIGLRNPWRFSFDRLTGDMYIGDVGQGAQEEVDFQAASSTGGENYGWRCMEGLGCTGFAGCVCNAPSLVLPVHQYNHLVGCSITGGYVYRGTGIPGFEGHYIFGDYCSGRIWSFTYSGGTVSDFVDRTAELAPGAGAAIQGVTSFGEDANGELYLCDFVGGEIFRIDAVCPTPTNYCTSTPNSTGIPGQITYSGDGSMDDNALVLFAIGTVPRKNGFFFYGQGAAQVPVYDGFRCIASSLHRLPFIRANDFGDAEWNFDVDAPPAVINSGSTWNFQYLYRDTGFGTGANFTDALSVVFCAH